MRLDRARANHPPAGARCASLRKRNAAWQIFYFSLITRAAKFTKNSVSENSNDRMSIIISSMYPSEYNAIDVSAGI